MNRRSSLKQGLSGKTANRWSAPLVRGFTLIELLVYTAILVIVAGLLVGVLTIITQIQQKESASTEVAGQLNFVMQTIQRLVRESSNFEIEAGAVASNLKLRMKNPTKDPTCLFLANNVIKLAEGPGANPNNCTNTTSDLTNDRIIVDKLEFRKFIQYPGHDTVSVDIQMTYNTQNPKSRVQRTLKSAIARVSAATFDSNLLPGSDNSYDVGYSPNPRWRNAAFSGDLLVSGNVGIGTITPSGLLDVGGGKLVVLSGGNVGIGTTGPGAKLHVLGGTDLTEIKLERGGGGHLDLTYQYDGTHRIGFTDGNAPGIWLFRVNYPDGTTWLAPGGGNVGIGTAGPAEKLHVVGNIYKTGTVSFIEDYPGDPTKQIVYVSLEGPEAGTYIRGQGQLVRGEAEIQLPEHFALVTEPSSGLTAQVTSIDESNGLRVVSLSNSVLKVKELNNGQSNTRFYYFINGLRKGYADFNPIQAKK
jgi:type II secretory pathway pseudopilin PulG